MLDQSTDHVDLEVELERPAILLVTDSYSDGWRARPLAGSSRGRYELVPANGTLRAIALDAGRHRLRIEYAPWASRAGHVVSTLSGVAWLGAAGFALACLRPVRSAEPRAEETPT